MTEIVVLKDVVAGYASEWIKVANTQGLPSIQIKDRFREQGFGEGAEELEVEGIDISPVSGASRIYFRRAANNTKAEVHRLGAVMLQTNPVPTNHFANTLVALSAGRSIASGSVSVTNTSALNANASVEESPQAVKRGRGRPKGSKNRPRAPMQRVTVPTWPNV